MDNYKIRVNNEAESQEAQELFEQLGYKIECYIPTDFPSWLVTANKGGYFWYSTSFPLISSLDSFKELTLPQLHDLVAQSKSNEQGLISGADALRAMAEGIEVEMHNSSNVEGYWYSLNDAKYTPSEILEGKQKNKPFKLTFRYKRTVKLEIEVPLPFKPNSEDEFKSAYRIQVGNKQIFWKTEADFLEATSQIQKILEHSK